MDFSRIYTANLWNGEETRSGPGSSRASTATLVSWLPDMIRELEIRRLLDVPCGECNWMPDLPCTYTGVDIVPQAVAVAKERRPTDTFFVADAIRDSLPGTDAIFSRDFMQHLTVREGMDFIGNCRHTGARWMIASSYEGGANTGSSSPLHAYRVNLELPPFDLGFPTQRVVDGRNESGKLADPEKFIGVWEL